MNDHLNSFSEEDLQHSLKGFQEKKCGRCEYWMKSSLCPKEKNVNGQTRGPSANEYPCPKFKRSAWNQKDVSSIEQELVCRNI